MITGSTRRFADMGAGPEPPIVSEWFAPYCSGTGRFRGLGLELLQRVAV